jgi:putative chitobiose transport system substrate-binding protein
MKRFRLTVIAAALTMVLAFAGMSLAQEKIQIEFWTISLAGPFTDWIEDFIARYEAEHPNVEIVWVDVPGADVAQKYLTAISAGMAPDVANVYGLAQLAELDVLLDLNEYISEEDKAAYFPDMIEALTFNGKLLGLPWYGGGAAPIIYSRAVFEEAGLDPDSPPRTYAEAFEVSRKIKDATGKYGLMTVLGQSHNKVDGGQELDWFIQYGIPLFSEDGKRAAFNTPEALELLTELYELYSEGYLPQEALTAVWSEAQQWYIAGRGAFTLTGPQIINRATPEVLEALDTAVGYPIVGPTGQALTSFQYVVISGDTKYPEQALDFALYVTGTQLQIELIEQVAVFPSRPDVLEHPMFKVESPQTLGEMARKRQVEWDGGFAVSPTAIPPSTLWPELAQAFARETQRMYTGQITPKEALDNAEAAWNRILSRQ